MEERLRDPFAAQPQDLHPAISTEHDVDSSIDSRLFQDFFATEEYRYWATGTRPWQLHCYGDPGSGKTELAAATARCLRDSQGQESPVATIFIREDVVSLSLIFVEDLLKCISTQLKAMDMPQAQYLQACFQGQPIRDRIAALTSDIELRISSLGPHVYSFLVLDGYDRISESLQAVIQQILVELHQHGLRAFMTRRVPLFAVVRKGACNVCRVRDLNLYWVCPECQKKESSSWCWLCYRCHESAEMCTNCIMPRKSFVENRQVVNVPLVIGRLKEYVSDQIRREFRNAHAQTYETAIDYILSQSSNNIALARLYLEDVLLQDKLDAFYSKRISDRLPGNVIAFFDAELQDILELPAEQRELASLSIVAVALMGSRVSFVQLEKMLRKHTSPLRSTEHLLNAARGWILQETGSSVSSYAPVFSRYVLEDYNEELTHVKRMFERRDKEVKQADRSLDFTEENLRISQQVTRTVRRPTLLNMVDFSSGSSISTVGTVPSISTSIETMSDSSSRQHSFQVHRPPSQSAAYALSYANAWDTGPIPPELNSITDETKFATPLRMDTGDSLASLNKYYTPLSEALPETWPIQGNHLLSTSYQEKAEFPRSLCAFCCDHVLTSRNTHGEHHITSETARDTADYCSFCKALYIEKPIGGPPKFRWAAYRWTIYTSVQARSGNRSIVIVFRPDSESQDGGAKRFHLFKPVSLPVASRNAIGRNTSPASTASQIRSWMQTCNSSHPHCHKSFAPSFVPTRIIDLGYSDSSHYRLINTKYKEICEPYCTLSHSWGSSKFITTTLWNVEEHLLCGISRESLPKNFQEAIEVVRLLGVRYVWIDSLCIIQDPPGDFKEQGKLMHAVYRNSYCNIVASDSEDSAGGLFRSREPESILPATFTVPPPLQPQKTSIFGKSGDQWLIVPSDLWNGELLRHNFIYSRAWVFQERLLAPRLLHFARNQIYWDCATISACETFPFGLPPALDATAATDRHWRGRLALTSTAAPAGPIDNESPYTFWDSAVTSYTNCNLTSQADKNLAIWSIAKILRDETSRNATSENYATGMWSKHLVEQLAWQVSDVQKSERLAELQYDNPSWAWTSVMGGILPKSRIEDDRAYSICDHDGNEVQFKVGNPNDSKDAMPVLVDKSLAIRGFVHGGRVRRAHGEGDSRWEFASNMVILEAFPDEVPDESLYGRCELLLLAASADGDDDDDDDDEVYDSTQDNSEDELGPSDPEEDQDGHGEADDLLNSSGQDDQPQGQEAPTRSDLDDASKHDANDTDFITNTEATDYFSFTTRTYRGIGLLMTPVARYISVQHDRLAELEKSHEARLKNVGLACCGEWPCKLQKEIAGIKNILAKAEKDDMERTRSESRYRRIGMVNFAEMSEGTYRLLKQGDPADIWLE